MIRRAWLKTVKTVVLLGLVASCVACGPSLRSVATDTSWWTSSQACAQGPFDLSWQAKGLRWGEGVTAELFSDHAFFANWRLELHGHRLTSGRIRTRARQASVDSKGRRQVRLVRDRQADTGRCQPRASDVGPVLAIARVEVATETETETETEAPSAAIAGELQAGAIFTATAPVAKGRHHVRFLNWRHSDPRSTGGTRLPKGGELRLVIWSEQPQDWSRVTVRLATLELRPDVPEKEFVAHLKIKETERAERRKEQRRKRKQARTQRQKEANNRRPSGSRAGVELTAQQRATQRRKVARWRLLSAERRTFKKTRRYFHRTVTPVGPPPRPHDEIAPPRPGHGATWIAGQWRWEGRHWVWWHGWWKTPARPGFVLAGGAHAHADGATNNRAISLRGGRVGFSLSRHPDGCGTRIGLHIGVRLHGGKAAGYIATRCHSNARNAAKHPPVRRARFATPCALSSTSCRQRTPPKKR